MQIENTQDTKKPKTMQPKAMQIKYMHLCNKNSNQIHATKNHKTSNRFFHFSSLGAACIPRIVFQQGQGQCRQANTSMVSVALVYFLPSAELAF